MAASKMLEQDFGEAPTWERNQRHNELARQGREVRWNRPHPEAAARPVYVSEQLADAEGPIIAARITTRHMPVKFASSSPATCSWHRRLRQKRHQSSCAGSWNGYQIAVAALSRWQTKMPARSTASMPPVAGPNPTNPILPFNKPPRAIRYSSRHRRLTASTSLRCLTLPGHWRSTSSSADHPRVTAPRCLLPGCGTDRSADCRGDQVSQEVRRCRPRRIDLEEVPAAATAPQAQAEDGVTQRRTKENQAERKGNRRAAQPPIETAAFPTRFAGSEGKDPHYHRPSTSLLRPRLGIDSGPAACQLILGVLRANSAPTCNNHGAAPRLIPKEDVANQQGGPIAGRPEDKAVPARRQSPRWIFQNGVLWRPKRYPDQEFPGGICSGPGSMCRMLLTAMRLTLRNSTPSGKHPATAPTRGPHHAAGFCDQGSNEGLPR